MVDALLELASLLGPVLAALLTVPLLQAIKRAASWVDNSPAALKQILGVVIAFVLTKLGAAINTVLPLELSLFTGETLESLIASGIAFAVHAGQKARAR